MCFEIRLESGTGVKMTDGLVGGRSKGGGAGRLKTPWWPSELSERGRPKGLVMVPCRRNARGLTDPLRPCGPSLHPPQGPDYLAMLQQGLWLVRSLKPNAEPKQVPNWVKASAWSLHCIDEEPELSFKSAGGCVGAGDMYLICISDMYRRARLWRALKLG